MGAIGQIGGAAIGAIPTGGGGFGSFGNWDKPLNLDLGDKHGTFYGSNVFDVNPFS